MTELVCWKCGASLKDVPRPITRHSNCLACYAELHCCRMCRKYDTRYISRCNDDRTDPPEDKERANYCEYFVPTPNAYSAADAAEAQRARDELAALFGEGPPPEAGGADAEDGAPGRDDDSETERARRELKRLFGEGDDSGPDS